MRVSSIDCSPARQRISTFLPGEVHYHRIKLGASLYLEPIYSYDSTPYRRKKRTARQTFNLHLTLIDTYRFFCSLQWRIQGRAPGGGGSPIFLDQPEAQRAEKFFSETAPPSPYLKVWIRHSPFLQFSNATLAFPILYLSLLTRLALIEIMLPRLYL